MTPDVPGDRLATVFIVARLALLGWEIEAVSAHVVSVQQTSALTVRLPAEPHASQDRPDLVTVHVRLQSSGAR
jgi:hypothetical protein